MEIIKITPIFKKLTGSCYYIVMFDFGATSFNRSRLLLFLQREERFVPI